MKIFDFFKKLFHIDEDDNDLDWYDEYEDGEVEKKEVIRFGKKHINLNDPYQMEKYVVSCCEQIKEATEQIDKSSGEYRLVTEYLMDMENLSMIEPKEYEKIEEVAKHISTSDVDAKKALSRKDAMPDDKFRHMDRFKDDIPKAIEDMQKNEEYKSLVREDLKNLEGEKVSYRFRDRELKATMKGAREITVVIMMAVFFIIGILLALQFMFGFDVSIGYFLVVAISAIAMTLIFLNYSKAKTEDRRVVRLLKTAITTQNTVKIRYVNVTNVIEYQYTKYKVNSSSELRYLWDMYLKEKKIREEIERATAELEGSKADLMRLLSNNGVKYPEMWLNQADALLDERELREIRHDLIGRRQGMRKRVDYNESVRKAASNEIRELVDDYPKLANLIIDIVGRYEET